MLDISLVYLLNFFVGQSPLLDRAIIFFASDLAYVLVAALGVFIILAPYVRRKKLEMILVTAVSCLVARGGITELIRFVSPRPRPFVELSVNQLLPHAASPSFPSGHATFFFALATAVFLYDKRWGSAFLAAATLISISRVAAGIHYPSDIIAGALIGSATALAVALFVKKWFKKDQLQPIDK